MILKMRIWNFEILYKSISIFKIPVVPTEVPRGDKAFSCFSIIVQTCDYISKFGYYSPKYSHSNHSHKYAHQS